MKALVVYDSEFGNTEQIANAIAGGLSEHEHVQVMPVEKAGAVKFDEIDLLVVGGPTQNHGLSPNLRAWLDAIPPGALVGVVAAAFDTRYHMPRLLTGSAAKNILSRLQKLGAAIYLPPESFYVDSREGPLTDGELERAERWAILTPAGVVEETAVS